MVSEFVRWTVFMEHKGQGLSDVSGSMGRQAEEVTADKHVAAAALVYSQSCTSHNTLRRNAGLLFPHLLLII